MKVAELVMCLTTSFTTPHQNIKNNYRTRIRSSFGFEYNF